MKPAEKSGGALICGSVAYDAIMVFPGHFKEQILPDRIHVLNVSFLVPTMRREFGGCAGNIAYNLRLLGDRSYPMATVGRDFAPYAEWLAANDVPVDYICVLDGEFTAQAFITTDLDDNQITAFHPGAMQSGHLNQVARAQEIDIGIVAPDARQAMIDHAAQFADACIPFMFDPGQQMPMFNGAELRTFIDQATWVAVNDYEWRMLQQKTGFSERDMTARADALIVTRGSEGSEIYADNRIYRIPCAKARSVINPTGCGDAYRSGLLHGLLHDLDWETTGRIGSLMGAIKIESLGPQNHRFTMSDFTQRYQENFGADLTSIEPSVRSASATI